MREAIGSLVVLWALCAGCGQSRAAQDRDDAGQAGTKADAQAGSGSAGQASAGTSSAGSAGSHEADAGLAGAGAGGSAGTGAGSVAIDAGPASDAAKDSGVPVARKDAGSTMHPWSAPDLVAGSATWSSETGWGESQATLCDPKVGTVSSHSIYSHEDDVYVAVSVECNFFAEACTAEQGISLYHHDGEGWGELLSLDSPGVAGVRAFPNGTIALFGVIDGCGVRFVKDGEMHCSLEGNVVDLFIVDDDLAYAARADRVLQFDGTGWTPVGEPLQPQIGGGLRALWASRELVVAVASAQQIYFLRPDQDQFERQAGVPAGDYVSVWAFSQDDVWAGTSGTQLVHFDGSDWSVAWTAQMCRGRGISSMWGAEGQLYFTTAKGLYLRRDATTTTIADWGCQPNLDTRSLWGNSLDELFIAVADESSPQCGETIALLYDGSELRQL